MSRWTDLLKWELKETFKIDDVSERDDLGSPELMFHVPADKLIDVVTHLKNHKETPFDYLRCLTAIDYPAELPGPPNPVEPFHSLSTLTLKERQKEHTGSTPGIRIGRSAPLDPPRLDKGESPHKLNDLDAIKKVWPKLRVMWDVAPEAPKPAPAAASTPAKTAESKPAEAKGDDTEPADTKTPVSNDEKAKMVVDKVEEQTEEKKEEAKEAPAEEKKEETAAKAEGAQEKEAPKADAKPADAKPAAAPATPPPAPKYDRNEIEVVYTLFSFTSKTKLTIKVTLPRDKPEVESLCGLYKAANWYEREVYDLYGVTFKNHPEHERIFMDYPEFPGGYPLRKDYKRPGFMVRLPKL